jgi:predicted DNA-binding transcriptional regulator YafY
MFHVEQLQDMNAKKALLTRAINGQKQIAFQYKLEEKQRIINSHCLYTGTNGAIMLDAWQESGQTDTKNQQFKCFFVQFMGKIEVVESSNFTENEKFNFNSMRYEKALCRIGG